MTMSLFGHDDVIAYLHFFLVLGSCPYPVLVMSCLIGEITFDKANERQPVCLKIIEP